MTSPQEVTLTLQTERLTLRPLRDDDANAIVECLQDWAVVKNLARVPWPYAISDARTYINERRFSDNELAFVIDDGALCGMIGLRKKAPGEAIIGYWLGRHAWGIGYATEAVRWVVRLGFQDLQLQIIEAGIMLDNAPSMNVLKKAGFSSIGNGTCESVARGDVESRIFQLGRTEWMAR